ncbi:hypothetical protein BN1708_019035, partial [Verticillium longisporum]
AAEPHLADALETHIRPHQYPRR